MGCVSSTLLSRDEEFPQIGASAAFSHHIVSLTSTTYGFLTTLDHHPPPPTAAAIETINSWDLMSGLESEHVPSFRHLTIPTKNPDLENLINKFEPICPPKGENRVILYTTSLRGVRKTFEDCEAVRSAIRGLGIAFCERDISMDRGFRDEMRKLMKGRGGGEEMMIPPRLFVNGRYVGGKEEVTRVMEDGAIAELVKGLPPASTAAAACEGCGGVGFLPCFKCHGSCKLVSGFEFDVGGVVKKKRSVVVKCGDCNENGLVLCPICS